MGHSKWLIFMNIVGTLANASQQAIIIVPVADLVGAPIKNFGLAKTAKDSYQKIPLSDEPQLGASGCPRIGQLLFNEAVRVISIEKDENSDNNQACIAIENSYFIDPVSQQKKTIFWTQTKNLLLLNGISKKIIDETIPETPSYKKPSQPFKKNTLILVKPFIDSKTGIIFSAGTRFLFDPVGNDASFYSVKMLDPKTKQVISIRIPKDYARIIKKQTKKQSIACFVALLKEWAHQNRGIIFYVWGGSSFTTTCQDLGFEEQTITLANGKKAVIYVRTNYNNHPFTGFDCAGIILRAAQICGIPYFYKNTYTLARQLKPLTKKQSLEEGDLIWIQGHVMIISNLKKNLLIEARGYRHEFGIVHEIELEKVFKGIKTYTQLQDAYHQKIPLTRVNKSGKELDVNNVIVLKLESCWN